MKFQKANEKHILFWDTVLNDIYKGKLDDCLDFVDCKEKIFKQLFGDLKIMNNCFACEIANQRLLKQKSNNNCVECPTCPIYGWDDCEIFMNFREKIEHGLTSQALKIAQEIRDVPWIESELDD